LNADTTTEMQARQIPFDSHQLTQGSMPWPRGSNGGVGRKATRATALVHLPALLLDACASRNSGLSYQTYIDFIDIYDNHRHNKTKCFITSVILKCNVMY